MIGIERSGETDESFGSPAQREGRDRARLGGSRARGRQDASHHFALVQALSRQGSLLFDAFTALLS